VPLTAWMAHAPLREFPHYYLQAYPWNALLVGLFVEELWLLVPARRFDALLAALLLVPALWWTRARLGELVPRYDLRDRSQWNECRFVRAHSQPGDRLFIWGYRPEFYVACERKPASRFVYTTMVAGFVEWFYDSPPQKEAEWAAPGGRDAVIADLEQSRPPVLIDLGVSFGRKLRRYPQLMRYVDTHYCVSGHDGEIDYYVRRREDGSCPPP
jgi:hypothetical protein